MFWSRKKDQAEKQRKAREDHNLHQMFFQLPAELRNQIYELVIPSDQDIVKRSVHNGARGWPGGLPALLHVCHQLREEIFPVFYGTNVVTVILEDLMLHPRSQPRIRSCVNLIPQDGTLALRKLKIETCARCFHEGWARQPSVHALIDRTRGTLLCKPRYSQFLKPCCNAAAVKYSERLSSIIKSSGFLDGKRKLKREDFERLMRRMDENRRDWPMSPKRVIPRYYVT